jgi:hypothetical protein
MNDPYADLCEIFEHLLKILPAEQQLKPGKLAWVNQFLALLYPADQRKHAWNLWRMAVRARLIQRLRDIQGGSSSGCF